MFILFRMLSTTVRHPVWEVTQIEAEHDYCKHPSLNVKEATKKICSDKLILLEESKDSDNHDSDVDIDIESVKVPPKELYNVPRVKSQYEEIEKHARKICYGNETPENSEPTEDEEAKLTSFIAKVR